MGRPTGIDYGHVALLDQTFTYDSLGRLVESVRPEGSDRPVALLATVADEWDWELSGSNDWDAVSSVRGAAPVDEVRGHDLMHGLDEVSTDGVVTATFAQDRNGNMIWDDDYDLFYDAHNRRRRVAERSTGDIIAEYAYDAVDRRITKTVTNSGSLDGITQFVYDAENVIAEYDQDGFLLREFVHGPGYDEPLVMDQNTGLDANATEAAERYYYLHDALGSVTAN